MKGIKYILLAILMLSGCGGSSASREQHPTQNLIQQEMINAISDDELLFEIEPLVEGTGDSLSVYVDVTLKNTGRNLISICEPDIADGSLSLTLTLPSKANRISKSYESYFPDDSNESQPKIRTLNPDEGFVNRIQISPNDYSSFSSMENGISIDFKWQWAAQEPYGADGIGLSYIHDKGVYDIIGTYVCTVDGNTIVNRLDSQKVSFNISEQQSIQPVNNISKDGLSVFLLPHRLNYEAASSVFASITILNVSESSRLVHYFDPIVKYCQMTNNENTVLFNVNYEYYGLAVNRGFMLNPGAYIQVPMEVRNSSFEVDGDLLIHCVADLNGIAYSPTASIHIE